MVCTIGACVGAVSAIRSHKVQNNNCEKDNRKNVKPNTLTDYQKKRLEEQIERIVEQDIRNGTIVL